MDIIKPDAQPSQSALHIYRKVMAAGSLYPRRGASYDLAWSLNASYEGVLVIMIIWIFRYHTLSAYSHVVPFLTSRISPQLESGWWAWVFRMATVLIENLHGLVWECCSGYRGRNLVEQAISHARACYLLYKKFQAHGERGRIPRALGQILRANTSQLAIFAQWAT